MTLNLRYYDPFNEEMVYSSEFPAMSNFFISYEKRVAAGNEPILMVSTGLKDKNEKEIFEGDLCKDSTGTSIVKWDERFASFCLTRNGWMFRHFFGEAVEAEETEVVGHIYEEGGK